MTMRLDLRKRPDPAQPGHTLYEPLPFGCADCGRWFMSEGRLVHHVCDERGLDYIPRGEGDEG